MDRDTYYVSVGEKKVSPIKDDNDKTFDFEIIATPQEAEKIQNMFTEQDNADVKEFMQAHVPLPSKLHDHQEQFDDALVEIYRQIYLLGTPQTKQQIQSLDIFH